MFCFSHLSCKMSRVQTEKKGGVRRVISHREGALLIGLMFPGPFQFFHPGTQRETDVHEQSTANFTATSLSRPGQAVQCHTVQPQLPEITSSRLGSSGSTAGLWKECWSKLRGFHYSLIRIKCFKVLLGGLEMQRLKAKRRHTILICR